MDKEVLRKLKGDTKKLGDLNKIFVEKKKSLIELTYDERNERDFGIWKNRKQRRRS
ncbi:MAG: hypothetical protein LBT58_02190 [Endomicrobium sp.]|jgi:hypothetical protein|nr:hypothetical protein [Endomicrobium sp.]